ncbi:MAG: hypothetical protein ACREME_10385, partial [Gemmatimonadales bacterium]
MSRGGRVYLDLILPTVGRIKRVTERRTRDDVAAMLRALAVQAQREPTRWALLWEIKDGRRALADVFALYEAGRLDELPTLALDGNLEAAVDGWADRFPASDGHRLAVKDAFRKLRAQVQRKATIGDLARLVAGYREACREKPRTFNLARSAAQA